MFARAAFIHVVCNWPHNCSIQLDVEPEITLPVPHMHAVPSMHIDCGAD